MDFDDFFFITISEDGTNYLGKALGDVRKNLSREVICLLLS